MRRITRESGLDVFLNVHDIAILEPKSSVMIGMMTPKGLKEHFGSRNRILVDAFACFLAIPELMEAKKRADAQKAARYRRATEAVDDSDDWDDQDDGDDE
ncbi:MAG TPA: hypothetical protein PK765_05970 [bacterium]|nr:hypothetical protein [bacterium]